MSIKCNMNNASASELLEESESNLLNKPAISEKNGNNMDCNTIDLDLIKTAVKMILKAIGENPDRTVPNNFRIVCYANKRAVLEQSAAIGSNKYST